ncbi:MAG: type II secretion system protein [Candidatus Hydrothermia bacterium]|jgi:prepilin-type N-terminal cleavage/methylation domain-containing protein
MRRKGFTLLEMAIVLVAIGLLIGLVMRGIVLQRGAKVKRTSSDIRNIHTAVIVYYERNNKYPGDTDNNGIINNDTQAWTDLQNANIAYKKPSPYGTDYVFDSVNVGGSWRNRIKVVVNDAGDRTEIDRILDDGNLSTGAVQVISPDTLYYIID